MIVSLKITIHSKKDLAKTNLVVFRFKGAKDNDTDNELIEFRIAGGSDYNPDVSQDVVKAVVRYGTIMKAGYDDNAFRRDYINAVSDFCVRAQEVDPERAKEFDEIESQL